MKEIGKGLAERAFHPDELRESSTLTVDAAYYLSNQVSILKNPSVIDKYPGAEFLPILMSLQDVLLLMYISKPNSKDLCNNIVFAGKQAIKMRYRLEYSSQSSDKQINLASVYLTVISCMRT